jgi:hypothetical protein
MRWYIHRVSNDSGFERPCHGCRTIISLSKVSPVRERVYIDFNAPGKVHRKTKNTLKHGAEKVPICVHFCIFEFCLRQVDRDNYEKI